MTRTVVHQSLHAGAETDLLTFGEGAIAYVRPVRLQNTPMWGIFSAQGEMVGAAETRGQAIGTILQNDLEAASLH